MPSRNVQRCVGWLTTTNGRQPALRTPAKALHSAAREGGHPTVAGIPFLRLLIEGLTDGEERPAARHFLGGRGRSLPRDNADPAEVGESPAPLPTRTL